MHSGSLLRNGSTASSFGLSGRPDRKMNRPGKIRLLFSGVTWNSGAPEQKCKDSPPRTALQTLPHSTLSLPLLLFVTLSLELELGGPMDFAHPAHPIVTQLLLFLTRLGRIWLVSWSASDFAFSSTKWSPNGNIYDPQFCTDRSVAKIAGFTSNSCYSCLLLTMLTIFSESRAVGPISRN